MFNPSDLPNDPVENIIDNEMRRADYDQQCNMGPTELGKRKDHMNG